MARLVSNLLLLTVQYVALDCTKQTSRWVYKPYGIEMCRALCQDSPDTFYYVKEDLICRQVSTNGSTRSINVPQLQCLMEDRRVKPATACPFHTALDVCNRDTRLTLVTQPQSNDISKSTVSEHKIDISGRQQTGATEMKPHQSTDEDKTQPELTTEGRNTKDQVLAQYDFNMTLHNACQDGRLDVVKYILSHRLEDINCRGKRERTPVMVTAMNCQVAVFDYLVSQGCDLSAVDDSENNVLHTACYGGNSDIVRKLIVDKKCDMERRGRYGRTPVMWAVISGHREVVELLAREGCDLTAVDYKNDSIIHLSCYFGYADIVKYILSQEIISIESRGRYGRTPVMMAASGGNTDIFDLLDSKNCNLMAVDDGKNNILHCACDNGHVDMVKYLLTLRAVKTMEKAKNKRDRTPVQQAEKQGYVAVVSLFN